MPQLPGWRDAGSVPVGRTTTRQVRIPNSASGQSPRRLSARPPPHLPGPALRQLATSRSGAAILPVAKTYTRPVAELINCGNEPSHGGGSMWFADVILDISWFCQRKGDLGLPRSGTLDTPPNLSVSVELLLYATPRPGHTRTASSYHHRQCRHLLPRSRAGRRPHSSAPPAHPPERCDGQLHCLAGAAGTDISGASRWRPLGGISSFAFA
jgi:hypothetical protein